MNIKTIPTILSTIAFSATVSALDYTDTTGESYVTIPTSTNPVYAVNLSAGAGVDLAKFDANKNPTLFYLFTQEDAPNPNASYLIEGGATIVRSNTDDQIIGFRKPTAGEGGNNATMTFANGTYNLGTKNSTSASAQPVLSEYGVSLSVWGANGTTSATDTRAIIFENDTVLNAYAPRLAFKTNTNTSIILKGVVNVFNHAIPTFNEFSTETPENPTYGRFVLSNSTNGIDGKGNVIVDGGTINASEIFDLIDTKIQVINSGKINLHGDAVKVDIKNFILGDDNASTQELLKTTGTLTITGTNFTSKAGAKIEAGNLSITATNANIGGTVVTTGKMTNGYGVNYTSNASITTNTFLTGETSNVVLDGAVSITSTAGNDAFVVYNNSTLTFDKNASLDLNGNARMEVRNGGTLIVKSAEKSIQTRHLWLQGKTRVELHSKEAFTDNNGTGNALLLINSYANATINVKETNTFVKTSLATYAKLYLELDFASADSYINLGEIYTASSGLDINVYIKNFENNRIKATLFNAWNGESYFYLYDETSQSYVLNEDLQWVGDTTNGYWLTLAVPEPAEWAMILGVIALGFAIYRRRK